jgi:ribosomal protein S18 acetylase RimI-like enzyme
MHTKTYTTSESTDFTRLQTILNANPEHAHIHSVDMPYRLTSTWQDQGCELMVWEKDSQVMAWAVFQPPWCNLDYAIQTAERGSSLEQEVFAWGKAQMLAQAKRSAENFYGSVELFEDTPNIEQTIVHLEALGFEKFDWSILRFEKDLSQPLAAPELPDGFSIRPLRGEAEVEAYVKLHQAAFESKQMTEAWRRRMLKHPAYFPELDLVAVDSADRPVGFCVGWLWQAVGQIEPLGVHPNYQGSGLGSALEHAALQALQNKGARRMHVDHVSGNEKAIALSLKTGFKQIHNAVRYFIKTDVADR